jgi:hypothetical protein
VALNLALCPARILACSSTTLTSQRRPDKILPLLTCLHSQDLTWPWQALLSSPVNNLFFCSIHGDSWTQALPIEPPNEDVTHNMTQTAWPVDTDLVFSTGSNKLRLTNQRPLVRAVLHEAIELLRAAMLFNNSFPDVCAALGLIKDCVFSAAESLKPGTAEILERLTRDADYLSKITPLVWLGLFQDDFTDDIHSCVPGSA